MWRREKLIGEINFRGDSCLIVFDVFWPREYEILSLALHNFTLIM